MAEPKVNGVITTKRRVIRRSAPSRTVRGVPREIRRLIKVPG
jgi:hypothetical protein